MISGASREICRRTTPCTVCTSLNKGFNGEFTEFVGEMDLLLSKPLYVMIDKATKLYQHRNVLKYRRENRDKAPEAPKER